MSVHQKLSIDEGIIKLTQATILPANPMIQSKSKNQISQNIVFPKASNRNSAILTENLEERMQKKGKDLLEKMMQKQERERDNSSNSKNTQVSGIATKFSKIQTGNKKSLTKGSRVTERIKERRQLLKTMQQKSACTIWVQKMRAYALPYLQNSYVEILMSISTIYCLYADDVRQYAFSKDADIVFYDITFTCFILFFLDCFFSCLIRDKYFLSFQFYMDFVSTISLIFDIPWLSIIFFGTSLDGSQVSFLKAGRVTRVTARATRIVRFVKLVRIVRVGKLYKHAFENINRRVMKILQQDKQNNNENEREDELRDKESPRCETLPNRERQERVSLDNRKLLVEEEKDNVNNSSRNGVPIWSNNLQSAQSARQIQSGRYLGIHGSRKSQFAQGKSFLDTNPNDITLTPVRQPKNLLSQTVSPTSKLSAINFHSPSQPPQSAWPLQFIQQIQQQQQQNSQKRKLMKQRRKREQEEQQDFNSFEHTLFENYGGVQVSPLNAHRFNNQTITNVKNTSNKLALNGSYKSNQFDNILTGNNSPLLNKFMCSQDSIINSNNNNNNNNLVGSTMANAGVVDGILEVSLPHSTHNLTDAQQKSLPGLNHTFQPDSARANNHNTNMFNNNTNSNGQQQTSQYSSSYLSNNNIFILNNNNQHASIPLNISPIQPPTVNTNHNNNNITPSNSSHNNNNNITSIPLSKVRSNSFYSTSNANTPQLDRINSTTVFSVFAMNQHNNNNNNKDKNANYPYHQNEEPIDSRQFDTEGQNPDNQDEELTLLNKNKNIRHQNQPPTRTEDLFEQDTQQFVETKIGRHLSDLTTQRVILLIFSIILSFPFLTDTTWISIDGSYDSGLLITDNYYSLHDDSFQQYYQGYPWQLNFFINYHRDVDRYPLLWVQIDTQIIYISPLNSQIRDSEKAAFYYDPTDILPTTVGLYSYKADSDLSALLSIIQTSFIIVLLSMASYYFAKDFNEMLVDPIERMLIKIQMISSNPLEAARLAEDEAIAQAELKTKGLISYDSQFETHMLESTLIKIGALLALGFGEAGSEIIAKNMNKDGLVNPMIPGRKVLAIFGFVAIRNFADATEVLQENVMLFANEIADIVHNVCDAFHGTANKNLGDCFLMVWKFKESDEIASLSQCKQSKISLENNSLQGNDVPLIEGLDASLKAEMLASQLSKSQQVQIQYSDEVCIKDLQICQNFADLALIGFLKTIADSYKLGQTKRFIKHTRLIQQSNPSFELKLGFGLHVGWGIEGSIGSQFKIDASYLSPNVNMASRLENATKQYGIQLLLSGAVYSLLSPTSKSYMRHIDRVTVKGSKQPMDLYTCDIETNLLVVNQPEIAQKTKEQNKKIFRFVYRKKKDRRFDKILSGNIQVHKLFTTDIDFVIMRQNYTKAFMDVFHEGMGYYIDGDWEEANQCFLDAQEILTKNVMENQSEGEASAGGGQSQYQLPWEDGPIRTLIGFLKSHDFQAPDSWKGFRELTMK